MTYPDRISEEGLPGRNEFYIRSWKIRLATDTHRSPGTAKTKRIVTIHKMARSRGSARPASRPMQTRSASTMAAPARAPAPQQSAYSHPPATAASQPRQPGMFAQMASTAAGVAVGSAVGHTIGAGLTGMFSGSGSAPAEQEQQQQLATGATQQNFGEQAKACDMDARNFTRCLDENSGNFQICDYYLQQLKACQEAARQY